MYLLKKYNDYKRRPVPLKEPNFANGLRASFSLIQNEFRSYVSSQNNIHRPIDDISPDQTLLNEDKKWKALFLFAYGHRNDAVLSCFPSLAKIINNHSQIKLMFFSTLEPGKYIAPHEGRNIGVYRLQLGVDIKYPEQTYLKVQNLTIQLNEGEIFVFDDSFLHEAKNFSPTHRTVLIIDYEKDLPLCLRLFNKMYLSKISKSSYILDAIKRW